MLGETIGNFKIVRRLGRGGMGEVWLAEQQNLGTRVAVKILLDAFPAESEDVQRFFNEARAVSVIQHSGITKIFDSGLLPDGRAYMVMEFLAGESLAHRIARGGMSPAELAEIGRQIASVLEATHAAGIVHRDLKPENVFLIPDREMTGGERVKVLDFGVAKLNGLLGMNSPKTFGTLGTPSYMAPEQWGDASQVDRRVDLYALGCITFEMACGRPPFVCKTVAEACAKHLNDPPPLASSLVVNIPTNLDRLIAQLLEKDPDARPRSMREVERAFEQIARGASEGALETLPGDARAARSAQHAPTERTRPRRGALVAVGAVAIGALAVAMVALRKEAARPIEVTRPIVTAILEDAPVVDHHELAVVVASTVAELPADAMVPRPVVPHHVDPTIDRAAVQAVLEVHHAALAACNAHQAAMTHLTLLFTLGTDGRVSKLSANGVDSIVECVLGVVRTIAFPKPVGGSIELTMPLALEAPGLVDHLSKEQVANGLMLAEKDLVACMRANHVEARIVLKVEIAPSGRVTSATVPGALAGSVFENCTADVLRTIEFSPAQKGLSLSVPVTPD